VPHGDGTPQIHDRASVPPQTPQTRPTRHQHYRTDRSEIGDECGQPVGGGHTDHEHPDGRSNDHRREDQQTHTWPATEHPSSMRGDPGEPAPSLSMRHQAGAASARERRTSPGSAWCTRWSATGSAATPAAAAASIAPTCRAVPVSAAGEQPVSPTVTLRIDSMTERTAAITRCAALSSFLPSIVVSALGPVRLSVTIVVDPGPGRRRVVA
jgi:hypothetical protein